MDKRTLLAIVLSVVVVSGSFWLQETFWPTKPAPTPTTAVATPAAVEPTAVPGAPTVAASVATVVAPKTIVVENDVMRVTLSNEGAVATSIELKKFKELSGAPVEMVHRVSGAGAAFETSFGSFGAPVVTTPFAVSQVGALSYEFTQRFVDAKGAGFVLTKTFTLSPGDYMIKVQSRVRGENGSLPTLADGKVAYTLTYGPQMGPGFKDLLNINAEFRKYYHFQDGNRTEQMGTGMFLFWQQPLNLETAVSTARHQWSAMVGKYFTVVGYPDGTLYNTVFSSKPQPKEKDVSRLAFERPVLTSSDSVDTMFFYVGPKEEHALKKYNVAEENGFGLVNLKLERALEDNFLLGWLEVLLKWGLQGFFLLIPNWGIAIVLLTLVIKLATWPLTAKSYRANAAMQSLQPKLKELQEKYKDDQQKLQIQTMELYKKEGVNPLGGCLPMLLQIPVFFALYSLFNTQFDLRGAMFIPGWIPDLSIADTVWHWGFPLPLVNWTDLRILPIVMVLTQIWTSALSQPTGGMNTQMKIMTYGLPVMFLFMLYEMPSGLMVYWCVQNILTVGQQWYINTHFKKEPPKKVGSPNLKLAPKKSGNKLSK